ncbi:hypothetical protein EON83_22715 [bacterium]|nr:MAG: hypothetical protein EON83_22715 [bacterium]
MPPVLIGGQKVFVMPPVYWSEQKVLLGTSLTLDKIPPGVQNLEWRLEVVAAPFSPSATSPTTTAPTRASVSQYAVSSDTLQDWSRIPGALHVQKRFTAKLTGQELDPIMLCFADNQLSASFQGKIHATTQIRGNRSRLFRRLEAFDGKVHRLLWKDVAPDSNHSHTAYGPYVIKEWWSGNSGMSFDGITWNNSQNGLELDLRSVPASWGRITLQVEVVADPQIGRTGTADNQSCDLSTLRQLKARGWVYGSRTVVIRDEAAKKAARQKMKNLFIHNSSSPNE